MNTILRTESFATWLSGLRNLEAKARILARITSAQAGNFGDSKPVGDGVSEMRIDVGPGYRVYYIRERLTVYVLLAGGDKSTQAKDIKRARVLAKSMRGSK